ncbi:MAG TPA: hypothetical protein VL688_00575 [Verrucomicrobiae bacterium]|jgi:hypothetical protein|nr:hypothetical protein [Verrucomicrobiae bacterium]
MKSQTLVQCFILLGMMVFLAFVGEFMVRSFMEDGTPALYRVAPITSIPAWFKHRSEKNAPKQEAPAARHIKLVLHNGKEFSGELISEEGNWVSLKIDGNEVGFHRSEIKQMEEVPAGAKS